jgi:FAD/FMN-containing dehydrogenase
LFCVLQAPIKSQAFSSFVIPNGTLCEKRATRLPTTFLSFPFLPLFFSLLYFRLGVIPVGGVTGLVGGTVPFPAGHQNHAPVLLSLERMRRVINVDAVSGVLKAEAGCILEALDSHLATTANLRMPIDLGAKGSCQLGGMLATNAGGIRFLRYGSLHGSTLGMEVVLADGSVLSDLKGLRKDNTGYDLKQLFIGSEGTLGVITAAAISAPPKPAAVNVACFLVRSFEDVKSLLKTAKEQLGEVLSAFEFWDTDCSEALARHHHKKLFGEHTNDKDSRNTMHVLIETAGSDQGHDAEKLGGLCESVMAGDKFGVIDGILAQDQTQQTEFWALREGIPEACARIALTSKESAGNYGQVHKFDVSLPLEHYYTLVPELRRLLPLPDFRVFGFGHVGDGNVHINIVDCVRSDASRASVERVSEFVYGWVVAHGGSVSAEHGIGQLKQKHLDASRGSVAVHLMQRLKAIFDPNGILNPGKMLP